MNKSIRERFILVAAMMVISSACAKISAPTGGPVDKTPPVVTESIPENSSRNFKGKKIEITFDEYVVLDQINDKFMVSPPMKKKPRVFTRGKSVRIEYDDELKDSTTYTFYFLDAIRDLNAGNILENYSFVFSTGDIIDSLSVTGNSYIAEDLEIPEKTQVMMYANKTDSAVRKNIPDYISRVDQTGYFRINNIRPGTYRLYALKDDDNSKNYNRNEEAFAFYDSVISVTSPRNYIPAPVDTASSKPAKQSLKTSVTRNTATTRSTTPAKVPEPPALKGEYGLILFMAEKKEHYLLRSSRDTKYQLLYVLSLPPDTMKFKFSLPGAGPGQYMIENSKNRDTITVWLTDSTLFSSQSDTTIVTYPFTDTLGVLGYKTDTIPMRFITPRAPRVAKKAPGLSLESNIGGGNIKPGQIISFSSRTPLREPDTSKIRLYQLVEKVKNKMPYRFRMDTAGSRRIFLDAAITEGKQYLLIADSASFSNIFNEVTDSAGVRFSVRPADSYGTLVLNITNCPGKSIIQLLDKSEKLMHQKFISGDGKLEFNLLDRGTYRLRIIYDTNGDGKWTTGDFSTGRQPEAVSYYPEIEIKEGWVQDQDWDVSVRNFKEQKMRKKPTGK